MPTERPLRLSYHNGLLAGVCGGIAERLGWKPNVVRALFVLLSIVSGGLPGMLLYFLLYLLLPNPDVSLPARNSASV